MQMSSADGEKRNFWTTLPGILSGSAAVVTAMTGLFVAIDGMGIFDGPSDRLAAPGAEGSDRLQAGGAEPASTTGCLQAYLESLPPARVKAVENGSADLDVLGTAEPKSEPLALLFTDRGVAIGAARLHYITESSVIRVDGLVDAACAPAAEVRNIARGGDPSVLQNYDTLGFRLGADGYALRVGVGDTFRVNFATFQP